MPTDSSPTRDGQSDSPLMVYSLNISIALDLAVAVSALIFGVYDLVSRSTASGAFVVAVLFFLDFYYRLWRRPVREARLFEDEFEIKGRGTNFRLGYDKIQSVEKVRSLIGDFRTNSSVWILVSGYQDEFAIPNRSIGKGELRTDLYSWLQRKTLRATPVPAHTTKE